MPVSIQMFMSIHMFMDMSIAHGQSTSEQDGAVHTNVYISVYTYAYTHVYAHAYIHVHTHVHRRVHTRVHTQVGAERRRSPDDAVCEMLFAAHV